MTHNDILRRIRYVFDFSDDKMIALFALADSEVTREQVSAWLKKEEDDGFQKLSAVQLATFLDGLIADKRGKREGEQRPPEKQLTNNLIFKKLRIALNLTDEDILAVLERADISLSKHELSALFRKPGHKNYRECKDQVLRNFLKGLQQQYRPAKPAPSPWDLTKRK